MEVAESQTYMEKADEEEDFPCDEFMRDQMEITSSFVATDTGFFTLYVKNPGPYPIPGPDANWGYTALLGEIPAVDCYFQGFDDRVYCSFIIPEPLYNTAQPLRLFSSLCEPPIYTHDRVSILTREPTAPESPDEPEGCHSGLSQRACIAAGGSYECVTTCTCKCP